MTLPTADLISEVLRLDEEATKEPWEVKGADHKTHVFAKGEDGYDFVVVNCNTFSTFVTATNIERQRAVAALVAHYRTSAPELARRLRDAEEKLKRAEEALQKVRIKGIPAGIAVLGRNEDWRERVTEVLDTIDEALVALAPKEPGT